MIIDARPIFHERRIIRDLEDIEIKLEGGCEVTLTERAFLRSKIGRGETEAIQRRADELMQRVARKAVTGFITNIDPEGAA